MLRRAFPARLLQLPRPVVARRAYAAPFVPKVEHVQAAGAGAGAGPSAGSQAHQAVPGAAPEVAAAEALRGGSFTSASSHTAFASSPSGVAASSSSIVPSPTGPAAVVVEAREPPKPRKRKSFRRGLLLGLLAGIAWGFYDNTTLRLDDVSTVQPPTKCEPFPTAIKLDGVPFTCLGVGVRTVSFLKLHVYALGIYIASEDIQKARTALIAAGATADSLFGDESSVEVIDQVLRSGVRMAVRITPVRNTEFGHLRDGFVRSIMNHPMFQELNDEAFGEGLGQIKRAFGRKRKAPKGDTIYIVRTISGGLRAEYLNPDGSVETLGEVDNANVARVFFLQYLSGKNPNSPTARENAAQGLLQLV